MQEYTGIVRFEGENEWNQAEGWFWYPSEREAFGPFADEEDAEAFAAQFGE